MIESVLSDLETRMKSVITSAQNEFASVRTGRANPSLLERIQIDYYGTPTPLTQMATVNVPEPRLFVIQPWDKSVIKEIEKAILQSDLGLTPNNDGSVIRIQIPPLTEERRKDLVKIVRKEAEERRVAIRNLRRQANDDLKSLEKDGELSEDDVRRGQAKVQELTDRYIQQVDQLLEAKEKEIMEV